jgi:hypothetical protein
VGMERSGRQAACRRRSAYKPVEAVGKVDKPQKCGMISLSCRDTNSLTGPGACSWPGAFEFAPDYLIDRMDLASPPSTTTVTALPPTLPD